MGRGNLGEGGSGRREGPSTVIAIDSIKDLGERNNVAQFGKCVWSDGIEIERRKRRKCLWKRERGDHGERRMKMEEMGRLRMEEEIEREMVNGGGRD